MSDLPTVSDMMEAYALAAVEHASSSAGIHLDYSPESVREVESILATIAARPPGIMARLLRRRGPSPEVIDSCCKIYGAYVGEVLRRQSGGEWYIDEKSVPGRRMIALQKGEAQIWPTAKVRKRLIEGAEDDVWFYFQFVQKHWEIPEHEQHEGYP